MNPMQRNIALYPWYHALFSFMAWIPIFFLFFSEHLTLEQVLQLEAIYYAAVVLLEVPSGYFSDVVGRRPTLLISASAMCLAYTLFLLGDGFGPFVAAQILLATSFAFKSGTDTSFHYDSLAALGQVEQYGDREAVAGRNGFIAFATAVILGGAVGLVSLHLAYGLSLLGGAGALLIVFNFCEPSSQNQQPMQGQPMRQSGFLRQLRLCLGYAKEPALAWLLTFVVLMTVLDHIPYEFYQPYLALLSEEHGFFTGSTPLVAGIIMGVSSLLGAWAAAKSIWLRDHIGLSTTLLGTTAIQTVLIAVMGLWLHPLVVPLILLRTLPQAIFQAPLNATLAPKVPQAQRATYLSMQSLAGRLAFSMTLLALSATATTVTTTDWPTLAWMLQLSALLGVVGLIGLWATRRRVEV